ncbi:MAG: hypothetical protein VB980_05600 [Opitutales bacterium]|jgi:hypothetical protein
MPVYRYQVVTEDDSGEIFEVEHSAASPSLRKHPLTGDPVTRLYDAPNLSTQHTEGKTKRALEADNLNRHGFSRYERDGSGSYHKTAGQGPDSIEKE